MTYEVNIGGSEIAAVMGLSRWKSPLRLWAEKTGKIKTEDISNREYIQLGNELEDFVAKKFEKMSGKKVRRDTRTFKHKMHPYLIGHVDRIIVGEDELLECKTCNAWKAHEWEGEDIPQEYILQVMWYLGISGRSKGYIAVLIGGQKFVWKEIQFDEELFKKMIESAILFVEHFIKEDVAPMAAYGDNQTVGKLYPTQTDVIMTTEDKSIDELIGRIEASKKIIDDAAKIKDEEEARLKQRIGYAEGVETPQYKVVWKSQNSTRVDFERLKADGIYEKYAVVKQSRVLRIGKRKEKRNGKSE